VRIRPNELFPLSSLNKVKFWWILVSHISFVWIPYNGLLCRPSYKKWEGWYPNVHFSSQPPTPRFELFIISFYFISLIHLASNIINMKEKVWNDIKYFILLYKTNEFIFDIFQIWRKGQALNRCKEVISVGRETIFSNHVWPCPPLNPRSSKERRRRISLSGGFQELSHQKSENQPYYHW
jgi:hypothetical protein